MDADTEIVHLRVVGLLREMLMWAFCPIALAEYAERDAWAERACDIETVCLFRDFAKKVSLEDRLD